VKLEFLEELLNKVDLTEAGGLDRFDLYELISALQDEILITFERLSLDTHFEADKRNYQALMKTMVEVIGWTDR